MNSSSSHIDSTNLFGFFYKWWKTLFVILLLAVAASSIVSYLIPEKYKSTAIIFPTATYSVSRLLMNDHPDDLMMFGAEDDIERMIEVLNSSQILEKIDKKYKLMEHYGIDTTSKLKNIYLKMEFQDNVQFKKTEYMSVKIEVLDRDPLIACNMANDIAAQYDSTMKWMRKGRAATIYDVVHNDYVQLQKEMKLKEDSLHKLMQLGINDYETQAERLHEALGKAIVEGETAAAAEIEQKLKIISTYGMDYISLRDNIGYLRGQINLLKIRDEQAKADVDQNIQEKYIVEKATPSLKKAYPVRWLIVVGATLSALLFAVIGILAIENIRRFKTTAN